MYCNKGIRKILLFDKLVKNLKRSLSLDGRGSALLNSRSSERDPFGGFNRVKVRVKINDITTRYVPPPLHPLPPGEGKCDFLRSRHYLIDKK